jgi:cytochrome oxidase Cu insertion factor (SCO1/SenC/PrrC family)
MRTLAVIAALFALVAAGCGGESGDEAAPPAPTETAPPADASSRPQAAAIEGTTLDGEPISLADFRGRAVLVNVWSSW